MYVSEIHLQYNLELNFKENTIPTLNLIYFKPQVLQKKKDLAKIHNIHKLIRYDAMRKRRENNRNLYLSLFYTTQNHYRSSRPPPKSNIHNKSTL